MTNPSADEIRDLLRSTHTIAVVGLSDNPGRASHHVAAYLQDHGYRIIPVNPTVTEVLVEKAYPRLEDVPEPIDLVDVCRRPEHMPGIVDAAIKVGAKAVWLQLGIVHEEVAAKAQAAGLRVVQDRCTLIEHGRLIGAG